MRFSELPLPESVSADFLTAKTTDIPGVNFSDAGGSSPLETPLPDAGTLFDATQGLPEEPQEKIYSRVVIENGRQIKEIHRGIERPTDWT